MPSSDNSNNNPPDASRRAPEAPLEALRHNAQILEMLTAVVGTATAEITKAQRESTEALLAGVESRLSRMEKLGQEQTALLRTVLARPADPASAAEPVPRQVLQMERAMLWTWEAAREGPQALRLPRPSIIGRALYDLQHVAAAPYEGSYPAEIYITISVSGRHHLSAVAGRFVDAYNRGKKRAMAAKINEHLEPRFEALSNRSRGRYYADNAGDRRSLTTRGCSVFANWPRWDARDDDLTGYGPSPSGSPAPAPAGGTSAT